MMAAAQHTGGQLGRSGLNKASLTSNRNLTISLRQPGDCGQLLILPLMLITNTPCIVCIEHRLLQLFKIFKPQNIVTLNDVNNDVNDKTGSRTQNATKNNSIA